MIAAFAIGVLAAGQADCADASEKISGFLRTYCIDCHGEADPEADLNLVSISRDFSRQENSDVWQTIAEKLVFGQMPPDDAEQPVIESKQAAIAWIETELSATGRTLHVRDKLRSPEYGNYVDHQTLFDGSVQTRAYSPARIWRKSPYVFDAAKYAAFGNNRQVVGQVDRYVKQPFAIEDKHGFRDFSAILHADSATLSTLLRNAAFVVDKQLEGANHTLDVRRNGPADPATFPKDKKGRPKPPSYRKTIPEFEAVVLAEGRADRSSIQMAIAAQFELALSRTPLDDEVEKYTQLIGTCIEQGGNAEGLRTGLMAILVSPEAVYRMELGQSNADQHGRRMLSPAELAFAISYALTDSRPDPELVKAAAGGRLTTREDVRREVERIWDSPDLEKPRILRFFREFFGYHHAAKVFKDDSRFHSNYTRGQYAQLLVTDADTLVLQVLHEDREVLSRLLTTEHFMVAHSGDSDDEQRMVADLQKFHEYFKNREYKKYEYKLDPQVQEYVRSIDRRFFHSNGNTVRNWMKYLTQSVGTGLTPMTIERKREYIYAYNLDPKTWDYPATQPFVLDEEHRAGLLTHPSWLIAHSLNLDNDPVRRGKWIRERLLADTVPELPITVDARIPENPHQSLRERFSVVEKAECWKCHVRMNPLGMPFEMFDDFGRYRTREKLLANGEFKSVDSTGELKGTGDQSLDGDVTDAIDLVHRLARSERVRQSFVRHCFRYWMGRNETLNDSTSLISADQAYTESNGSFRALVLSLLTSDSFLYRKFEE